MTERSGGNSAGGQGQGAPATAQGRLRALEGLHVGRAKDRALWSFSGIISSGSP